MDSSALDANLPKSGLFENQIERGASSLVGVIQLILLRGITQKKSHEPVYLLLKTSFCTAIS